MDRIVEDGGTPSVSPRRPARATRPRSRRADRPLRSLRLRAGRDWPRAAAIAAYISGRPEPPYHALNLSAVVLRGIVAGGDDDAAEDLAVPGGERDRLRWRRRIREDHTQSAAASASPRRATATRARGTADRIRRRARCDRCRRAARSVRAATAMASLTRRTLSNVNPSAMTARQPSVPNWIED